VARRLVWQTEKRRAIAKIRKLKEQIDQLKAEEQRYERSRRTRQKSPRFATGKIAAAESRVAESLNTNLRRFKKGSADAEGKKSTRKIIAKLVRQVGLAFRRAACWKAKHRKLVTDGGAPPSARWWDKTMLLGHAFFECSSPQFGAGLSDAKTPDRLIYLFWDRRASAKTELARARLAEFSLRRRKS